MERTISACEPDKKLAPIVLFVYNRLDHTRETVEALQKNFLAQESELYIYSDGAENEEDIKKVAGIREYINSIGGFKKITVVARGENRGLARNVISGVSEIVNRYGTVIVLEDDLVTAQYFLTYMNDALRYYEDEKKVMQISGYNAPIDVRDLPETYFFRMVNSWGWATWKDRWAFFDRDPERLIKSFSAEDIYEFNLEGVRNIWQQVLLNQQGKIFTWAVFFYAAMFKAKGLVLYPRESYVQNIGNDGSGVHCGKTNQFLVSLANSPIRNFEDNISESLPGFASNKRFRGRLTRFSNCRNFIKSCLGKVGLLEFSLRLYHRRWKT
jgi:hypothetical protein